MVTQSTSAFCEFYRAGIVFIFDKKYKKQNIFYTKNKLIIIFFMLFSGGFRITKSESEVEILICPIQYDVSKEENAKLKITSPSSVLGNWKQIWHFLAEF